MGDDIAPNTSGGGSIDEWHDASGEGSSPSTPDSITKETKLSDETSKKKTNTGTNEKRSMHFDGTSSINVELNLGPAPLCSEEKAIKERENCDYSIKITLDMAKQETAPRKIRIYADGNLIIFSPSFFHGIDAKF